MESADCSSQSQAWEQEWECDGSRASGGAVGSTSDDVAMFLRGVRWRVGACVG